MQPYFIQRDLTPSGLGDKLTELWFYATCIRIVNVKGIGYIRMPVRNTEPDRIYDLDKVNVPGIELVDSAYRAPAHFHELDNHHMYRFVSSVMSPVSMHKLIHNKKDMSFFHPEIQNKLKGFDFARMFSHSVKKDTITSKLVLDCYKEICQSTIFNIPPPYTIPTEFQTLSNVVGLHLRIGDKINQQNLESPDYNIKYTLDDFQQMQVNAFKYILNSIQSGRTDFFVCSDDENVKSFFIKRLTEMGATNVLFNQPSGDITIDCMLDMMALTNCSVICQLAKVSTFSLAAALIGDKPLHNFYSGENPYLDVWKNTITITQSSS